jgi:flagellar hook-associated protein 3 FlgL
MSGIVERVSGFQEKIGKIDNYISSNKSVSTRLNSVSSSIESIQKIAEEFKSDLALYNEVTKDNFSLETSAKSALNRIEDLLNISIGGRYLFSGSRTNTAPIGDIEAAINTVGVADANYYDGDSQKDTAKISDGFELEYGVTANDPALQQIITGIRTAIKGVLDQSNATVRSGQDLVSDSIQSLSALRAKVNLDITTVESVNKQHEQLKIFWKQSLSGDIDADVTDATVELNVNTTILQATYQAFAKISNLKLTDYLN